MIRYELLRMLRNRKWKYLIPAALLAYIYILSLIHISEPTRP